jgi:hypothetical protein
MGLHRTARGQLGGLLDAARQTLGQFRVVLHATDPGVVHEHVEAAVALRDLGKHARHRAGVRDVRHDRLAVEFGGGLLDRDRVQVVQDHPRAFVAEAPADRGTEPARRARDQTELAIQSLHAGPSQVVDPYSRAKRC